MIDRLKLEMHQIDIKKGVVLQQPGAIAPNSYYVQSGLLRSYTIDEKGKEHIFMFAPEDWIVSDIESYAKEQPAALFIDALEDSVIFELNSEIIRESLFTDPEHEVGRLLKRLGVLQRRVINLMSATARQRYEFFCNQYPQLLNRVPQKMIASYLGITPEALSKIRGEIARES